MKNEVEVVVIGSGFGGAVAAKKLAEAGRDVLMLERGPWRDTLPVRSMGIENRAPLPQGRKAFRYALRSVRSHLFRPSLLLNRRGFIEAYCGKGINIICSSGVGGGSHIYAAMLARPASPDYWNGHHPDISAHSMDKYYVEAGALFNARPPTAADRVPGCLARTGYGGKLSTSGLTSPMIGILLPETPGRPKTVTTTDGTARRECEFDNDSVLGSPSGAKTTLDFAAIGPAMRQGLRVRALCEVEVIRKLPVNHASGMRYEIGYRDHQAKTRRTLYARHVILAAGCLNTVRLLLKSRDRDGGLYGMPRLGHGFGTNGGYFAFWKENSTIDLSRGLPLTGPFRAEHSARRSVLVLRAAIQGIDRIPMPGLLRRWLKRNAFIVALGRDNNNGHIAFPGGRLHVTYDKRNSEVYQEIDDEVRDIQRATGTRVFAPATPLTVQPLGGACLGADNLTGVVDGNGEIFDNRGIYVADAAALPASPGRPPSLTIAAWAAHVADRLLIALQQEAATGKP